MGALQSFLMTIFPYVVSGSSSVMAEGNFGTVAFFFGRYGAFAPSLPGGFRPRIKHVRPPSSHPDDSFEGDVEKVVGVGVCQT